MTVQTFTRDDFTGLDPLEFTFRLIPAEALPTGACILSGGAECGLRDAWWVERVEFEQSSGVHVLYLRNWYFTDETKIVTKEGDAVLIASIH